jgi:hypothetical protein
MTDKTQAMDRLIAQDADLIDMPAMTDVEKIAKGLTAEPWASTSFKGWVIKSDAPWPLDMFEQGLDRGTGFIVADIDFYDMLLLEDAESGTTKEQALAAVRNHLKGLPNDQ